MTADLFLHNQVKFCYVGDSTIFLDINKDAYKYADPAKTSILRKLASHSSKHHSSHSLTADSTELDDLVSQSLLTYDEQCGVCLAPTVRPTPTASIYDKYWKQRFNFNTIMSLLSSYHVAKSHSKGMTFLHILEMAAQKKARTKARNSAFNRECVYRLARDFIDARGLFYSSYNKCLLDSYVLLTFFCKRNIPVDWVFGVDLFPFRAHCWVEYQGTVLNDSLERVFTFTPIHII